MSLNRVIVLGNLGSTPELKNASGTPVTNLSVATTDRWVKDGEKKEATEWHRVSVFGKSAENCAKYLQKGQQVLVEGRLQTRSYEVEGVKKFSTEIVASNVQFLGGKPSGDATAQSQPDAPANTAPPLDEIPF